MKRYRTSVRIISKEIPIKKLQSIAIFALATPFITLGAGSVLAQSSSGQEINRPQQTAPRDLGTTPSTPMTPQGSSPGVQRAIPSSPATSQGTQATPRAGQAGAQSALDKKSNAGSLSLNKGFMSSIPAMGMQANNLIGAGVKTSGDVEVGPVSDLIINEDGHVVAIVVSVGGFLGMGEREVAIGWDDVTRSAGSRKDELELQISSTREELLAAPEYKKLK